MVEPEYPINPNLENLLNILSKISKRGFLPSVNYGSSSIGLTLLAELGIDFSSNGKANYKGIVINARRKLFTSKTNRVNLFAQVPDWSISNCKSSREIVETYGYETNDGGKKLYCTVNTIHKNSQNLKLRIDKYSDILHEEYHLQDLNVNVASWHLNSLKNRLLKSHPNSIWVQGNVLWKNGKEFFHYTTATFTGNPNVDSFINLLQLGTISIDHLIRKKETKVTEKGPLFKIYHENFPLLFPFQMSFDLLNM